MSVSPFSVQQDFQVQEYNQRRAAWKATEKKRKQEEKILKEQAKLSQRGSSNASDDSGESFSSFAATNSSLTCIKQQVAGRFGTGRATEDIQKKPAVEVKKIDDESDSDEITLVDALAV